MTGTPTRLRFFHDYKATPLWEGHRGGRNVSLERLPLSEDLRERLHAWARDVDRALMNNGYEWPDEDTKNRLEEQGRQLCHTASDELAPDYEVVCEID